MSELERGSIEFEDPNFRPIPKPDEATFVRAVTMIKDAVMLQLYKSFFESIEEAEIYLKDGTEIRLCDDGRWRTDLSTMAIGDGPYTFVHSGYATPLAAFVDSRQIEVKVKAKAESDGA